VELIIVGSIVVAAIWLIPAIKNVFVDGAVRSVIFITLLAGVVIRRKYSDEVMGLWLKYRALLIKK